MTESWVPPERDVSSLEALRVRVYRPKLFPIGKRRGCTGKRRGCCACR